MLSNKLERFGFGFRQVFCYSIEVILFGCRGRERKFFRGDCYNLRRKGKFLSGDIGSRNGVKEIDWING